MAILAALRALRRVDRTLGNPPDSSHYIHGTEAVEQVRLSQLNDLLNPRSVAQLGLRPGLRVLDVGSGLGQLSRAIGRAVGDAGVVVGVERDPEQLEEAERQAALAGEGALVEFRRGDATELPLADDEWGSFDVVHARFLLEHVRRPQAVVEAMVRAARPGGRIVLEDDDHDLLRLWPPRAAIDNAWSAYIATYEALGNDPYVGRRLVELLRAAGAGSMRTQMLFFGSCATDPNLPLFVDNFAGLLRGAREAIVATGKIDDSALDEGLAALAEWSELPDAAFWYTTSWAMGRKPGEAPSAAVGARAETSQQGASDVPDEPLSSARFLADSARDLNSSLRLDEVFRKIADRVHRLLDYQLFCILLWNDESEALEFSYSLRYGEHLEQEGSFPLGQGIGGSAAQLRRAVRVDDVAEDPRYVRVRHTEVEIRSELAVPLIVKDRLIGVLDLESTEYAAFTAEHEEVLTTLASHIAIALDNARLYEEVRAREERHQEELATARVIQRGLLPPPDFSAGPLEVAGICAPAAELSGDFFDLVPYPEGRLALTVADVAGKGSGAALYGAMAVGALRGQALRQAAGPAEVFETLGRQLAALKVPRRFLALCYSVWDPDAGVLTIANAGLPQPFRLRQGRVEELEVSGLPLGQPLEGRHRVLEIAVQPGDVYLIYSDGINECRNPAGEYFGDHRIAEYLGASGDAPPRAIVDGLIAAGDEFSGARATGEDDRTLLVLRFAG